MRSTSLDESLAFTALLEMDPQFRDRSNDANEARKNMLLEAWRWQWSNPHFWSFARKWLEEHP